MTWDDTVKDWLAVVAADSVVQTLLGTAPEFNLAGEHDYKVPSLEYTLVSPAVPFREVFWRTLVQLDFWMSSLADLASLERALVRLLHHDVPLTIGTTPMWSQMIVGGTPLEGAKDGVLGRSMDFHLIYLQEKYLS